MPDSRSVTTFWHEMYFRTTSNPTKQSYTVTTAAEPSFFPTNPNSICVVLITTTASKHTVRVFTTTIITTINDYFPRMLSIDDSPSTTTSTTRSMLLYPSRSNLGSRGSDGRQQGAMRCHKQQYWKRRQHYRRRRIGAVPDITIITTSTMSKRQSIYVSIIRQTDICCYIDCVLDRTKKYRSQDPENSAAEKRRRLNGQESAQRGEDHRANEGELADLSCESAKAEQQTSFARLSAYPRWKPRSLQSSASAATTQHITYDLMP